MRRVRAVCWPVGRRVGVDCAAVVLASYALQVTIGLIVVFGGIGVIVNGLIVYIVVQGLGERSENRRRGAGAGGEGEASI